jgi:hypothetical protein
MALNNTEIDKINDLYHQVDLLTNDNKLLKEQVLTKLDRLEDLIKENAGKRSSDKCCVK